MELGREAERIGVRRLWVLVHGLPPEAATWRQDGDGWSQTDHFLAALIEYVDMWGRINAQPHYRRNSLPKPVQIDRPGRTDKARPKGRVITDPGELARWFARNK